MEIKINYKKINYAPCNIAEEEDNEVIQKMVNQLMNGNNSCNLVSGYRGSGKTSMIHKLKKSLEQQKNLLFIDINLTEYQDSSLVLRKLIRGIYFNKPEQNPPKAELGKTSVYRKVKNYLGKILSRDKKIDKKFDRYINLLYLRTFNDVVITSSYAKKFELGTLANFTLENIKAIVLLILSGLLALFSNQSQINIKSLAGTFFVILASFLAINLKLSFSRSKNEEINFKSLYDNDISEYQIKYVLNRYRELGYKVIFALDEMDKIKKQDDLEKMISDLKPLMLSDLASFIIVSGQKLYYQYKNEDTSDDSLIKNVFTGFYHVPLKNDKTYRDIFKNLLDNKEDAGNEIMRLYIDSLILNSNSIIRSFLNSINLNTKWDDSGNTVIEINEKYMKIYKTDSLLLEMINALRKEIIEKFEHNDKCINDYLSSQLHIWTKKIKQKSAYDFREEDIFDQSRIESDLLWLKQDLVFLFSKYMELLKNKNFIDERIENTTKIYRKSNNSSIEMQDVFSVAKNSERAVINNFVEIKNLLEVIYNECISNDVADKSMVEIMKSLEQKQIIGSEFKTKLNETAALIKCYDQPECSVNEINITPAQILDLCDQLIFSFVLFILKNHFSILSDNHYKISFNNSKTFFIRYQHQEEILFYYSFFERISTTNFSFIFDKVNESKNMNSKTVLLISVQTISSQDKQKIIEDAYGKNMNIIFCYNNGKLKTKNELIHKLDSILDGGISHVQ